MTTLEMELNDLKSNSKQTTEVVSPVENIQQNITQVTTTIESDISEVYQNTVASVVTVLNYPRGSGSGVIYKVEGDTAYIVTNHHVIEGHEDVYIILNTGERLEAEVIGSDALSDSALLRVESELDLKPIVIGDSSALQVGETVLAIGSPSGEDFSGSLSVGVISGKDRVVEVDTSGDGIPDWDMVLLQTDAAINPGNSGGALVNMAGQLIGINTLKLLDLTVEGMGFANPINEVISILDQIQQTGEVQRPVIGISAISVPDLIARNQFYGLEVPMVNEGVYVNEVLANSPAQQADIKPGDIIVGINNQEVDDFKSFRRHLYRFKAGDTIDIEIIRDGDRLTKSLLLN